MQSWKIFSLFSFMKVLMLVCAIFVLSSSISYAGGYQSTKIWKPEVLRSVAIVEKLLKVKINPSLVLSMIHQESRGKMTSRSSKGAVGLMQITPKTARYLSTLLKVPYEGILTNPSLNILAGTYYFALLKKKFRSDRAALAAYNAGEQNYRTGKFRRFKETRQYIRVVLYRQKFFRDL